MITIKKTAVVVTLALLAGTAYGALGDVWDVGYGWTTANPDGPWSFRDGSNNNLLVSNLSPWTGHRMWSKTGITDPPWIHPADGAFGTTAVDDFAFSGGAGLFRWVSPVSGWIEVDGSLWTIWGGTAFWEVRKNGVSQGDGYSSVGLPNRVPFKQYVPVVIGDVIDLYITNSGAGGHCRLKQVAAPPIVNLTVQTSPSQVDTVVPAPGVHAYYENNQVLLTASNYFNGPNNYVFDYWQGDVADPQSARTSVTMDGDKTVTAVFMVPPPLIIGDIDMSECVTIEDLADFALRWVESDCTVPDYCQRADIDKSGKVDLTDFSSMGANWNQCYTAELHNLGFVVVAPTGGDFGWYTPGTQTSGLQEAIDFAVMYHKDIYIVGGGIEDIIPNGQGGYTVIGPVVYPVHEKLVIPAAENFRIDGGNYVLQSDVQDDMIVIDSQKNSDFHFGLLVHSPSIYGSALVKIKPQTPRPNDGIVGFSNSVFGTVGVVGEGAVVLESNLSNPKGIGLQLDASAGPIEFSRFHITEINACEKGFFLQQGQIRNNVFEGIFNHLTVRPIEVNTGSYNRFYSLLDITGVITSAVGANISGGSQNIFHLIFNNGFGSGNAIKFGAGALDNLVYARGLSVGDIVNTASISTNRIVPEKPVGFGISTPAFPASGVFLENESCFTVVATVKSAGSVSSWTLEDAKGLSQMINSPLYKRQIIYLEPGEKVLFNYSSAPSWSWRALR